MSVEYAKEFESIVSKARAGEKRMRVALAGADSESILKGLFEAEADGFVEPILIGNYKRIKDMLERLGLKDRNYDLQPVDDSTNVVQFAIEMIKSGNADCLMRGNTSTRDLLMPVLNKANHLIRDDRLVTHVCFLKIPGYDKLLAVSDVTLLINPSADGRREVLKNMVRALRVFDVEHPNIALLAMVEKPSFHMRDTVEDQTMVREHSMRRVRRHRGAEPDERKPADQGSADERRRHQLRHSGGGEGTGRDHLAQRLAGQGVPVARGMHGDVERSGAPVLRKRVKELVSPAPRGIPGVFTAMRKAPEHRYFGKE